MKQIVDQLNKIAKKIDENVDIPNTDIITDSLDAITTALGGTPNDSNLIVDKLEDIAGVAHGGGGGGVSYKKLTVHFVNTSESPCPVHPDPLDFVNDELCNIYNPAVPANGTADLDFLYVYDDGDYGVAFQTNIISSSDAVNCTYEPYYVTITDPTQDASITFTVEGD